MNGDQFSKRSGRKEGHCGRGNSTGEGAGPGKNLPVSKLADHSTLPHADLEALVFQASSTGVTWEFVRNAEFQAPQGS